MDELVKYLRALLALQLRAIALEEDPKSAVKPELLLNEAGLTAREISDLTRVMIALNGKYATKAEAVRALNALSIPVPRIAAILAMDPKHVYTALSREKKRKAGGDDGEE